MISIIPWTFEFLCRTRPWALSGTRSWAFSTNRNCHSKHHIVISIWICHPSCFHNESRPFYLEISSNHSLWIYKQTCWKIWGFFFLRLKMVLNVQNDFWEWVHNLEMGLYRWMFRKYWSFWKWKKRRGCLVTELG